MTIRKLLLEHYLAFQKNKEDTATWKEFSEHIGIDRVYLNKIYNGKRKAGEKTIEYLARFFQDPRFYDDAGIPRPDPQLQALIYGWANIPKDVQEKIGEEAKPYITNPPKDK
jgi:transcriptional regulator with XRE-family HTH domain